VRNAPPILFRFGFFSDGLGSADPMALLSVESKPRWRPNYQS